MSNSALLKSSLAKKYWMAATGLFLCTFLIGHLAGNLQLLLEFSPETAAQFNDYAYFMTHNIFIKIMSYITYVSILFHAIDGILLTVANRKARPVGYAMSNPSANSTWASRNMAMLGTLILAFIIMHMAQFWGRMHFGTLNTYKLDGKEIKDLYSIVIYFYKQDGMGLVWCFIYLIGMIALSFHLMHGFQSAFQSVGFNHSKYTPLIKQVGLGFSVLIPLAFAIIPFWIHFGLEIDPRWLEYMSK
jgi:succinate dehydrogenase / fumarate reductase cytochrome b subunit